MMSEDFEDSPSLDVIDEAYGAYSDLYGQVLRVSAAATPEQIQLAYFERRSEIFQVLGKCSRDDQREKAERQMDALVMAVRILSDPAIRAQYDEIRQERLRRRARFLKREQAKSPTGSVLRPPSRRKSRSTPSSETSNPRNNVSVVVTTRSQEPPQAQDSPRQSNHRISVLRKDGSQETDATDEPTSEDEEERQERSRRKSKRRDYYEREDLVALDAKKSFFTRVSEEISGAVEDTIISLDQVFNAFTLEERDIRAVMGRIDKAKRQFNA